MSEWLPACTRGNLSVDVFTVKRAYLDCLEAMRLVVDELNGAPIRSLEMRHAGELFRFLLRIFPDGRDAYEAMFASAADVRDFVLEMAPRQVRLFVAEDESEESLAAALRGEVH